jgi:uroporphyrinogen-III synthase
VVRESLGGTVVAFQHFGEHRPDAIALLTAAGAEVVEVPVYRWRAPADATAAGRLLDATISGQVDALTFTSAPAVYNFVAIAERQGVFDQVRAACNGGSVVMACIGPVCAAPAFEAGIDAPVIPARGRLGLLVRAVTDALQERRHTMRLGPSDVVVQGRAVSVDGQTVEMAPRERAVFELLLERRGAVVGKPTLLRTVWGDGCDTHAVEATVARLRQRLGPAGAAVQQVRGRGYRLHVQLGGAGP